MPNMKTPTTAPNFEQAGTSRQAKPKKPASNKGDATKLTGLSTRTIDEVRDLVEEALVELEGFLTAANAVVHASRDIANSDGIPVMDRQMNAMACVLSRAMISHNAIWSAVDCIIVDPRAT